MYIYIYIYIYTYIYVVCVYIYIYIYIYEGCPSLVIILQSKMAIQNLPSQGCPSLAKHKCKQGESLFRPRGFQTKLLCVQFSLFVEGKATILPTFYFNFLKYRKFIFL